MTIPKSLTIRKCPVQSLPCSHLATDDIAESQAKVSGLEYQVKNASASNWYNAKRINDSTYAYKVISDKDVTFWELISSALMLKKYSTFLQWLFMES